MNSPGFIVELFEGGPWLAQGGGVAIEWAERGVWKTAKAAQAVADKSISAATGEGHMNKGTSNDACFCGAMHSRRGAAGLTL